MGNNKTTTGTTTKEGAVVEQKITKKFVIVIDPGHGDKLKGGWRDPGTHTKDEKHLECDYVLTLSKAIKESLDTNSNYEVYLTREEDGVVVDKKLYWRTDFATEKNADIFISVHMDSGSKKGVFNLVQGNGDNLDKSTKLSDFIIEKIKASEIVTAEKDKPDHRNLAVLRTFNGEAGVLVEFGGIDSDIKDVINTKKEEIGELFLDAVNDYYNDRGQ